MICNFCDNCEDCMKLLEFRLELSDCYYYKPRTDAPYHPTRQLVYYLQGKINMEIIVVRKGRTIDWCGRFFFFFFFLIIIFVSCLLFIYFFQRLKNGIRL